MPLFLTEFPFLDSRILGKFKRNLKFDILQFSYTGGSICWLFSTISNIILSFYPEVFILETFAKILSILDAQMETPPLYGAFHIVSILLCIAVGLIVTKHCGNKGESYIRRFLLISSVLVIALEIYKQINFGFDYEGGIVTFDYAWYAFPFQFCSTPMYIGLLAALIKNDGIHKRLCAYLASYSLFAGVSVMLYPSSVFISTIGINIQTMICHGLMVSIGMVLIGTGYVKAELKTIAKACSIFIVLVVCAMGMNELAHVTGLLETDTFNMFFISPYCDPELPVYSLVQEVLPFPLTVVIYIAGFTMAAALILFIMKGLMSIKFKKKEASSVM